MLSQATALATCHCGISNANVKDDNKIKLVTPEGSPSPMRFHKAQKPYLQRVAGSPLGLQPSPYRSWHHQKSSVTLRALFPHSPPSSQGPINSSWSPILCKTLCWALLAVFFFASETKGMCSFFERDGSSKHIYFLQFMKNRLGFEGFYSSLYELENADAWGRHS